LLTSKQRAYLKGLANTMEPIFLIGKGGVSEVMIREIDLALEARELMKLKVLNNSMVEVREAAEEISEKTNSEVVQVIGGKFILFRPSQEKPTIQLP